MLRYQNLLPAVVWVLPTIFTVNFSTAIFRPEQINILLLKFTTKI